MQNKGVPTPTPGNFKYTFKKNINLFPAIIKMSIYISYYQKVDSS